MHPASSSEHCRCRAADEEPARRGGVGGRTEYRTNGRSEDANLEGPLSDQPRAPEWNENSWARKKLCWWQPPVPARKGPCPLDAQAAGRCDKGVSRQSGM